MYEAQVRAGLLKADPGQRSALAHLARLQEALEAPPPKRGLFSRKKVEAPRGLYLWGGVGRGKSMLMDLFAKAVEAPVERVHFHAFMQDVQKRLAEVRKSGVQDAILPVAQAVAERARVLCLDEMQITDIADAMIVGRLFECITDLGVTVVTTSNRVPEDLYKNGLNRQLFLPFIALLRARMEVHAIASPTDYRQGRAGGLQVYFTPADATAAKGLAQRWAELTEGTAPTPLRLDVSGRELVFDRHAAGVVRADFWELCGRPLGPGDFLALAGAVRVLILEGIPILSAANFNEAKRFVTLIDALYEARVRLIASAADIPERLYIEGTGTFEFERTASRLREMQSDDWARD
ncbi:cell division protein ZapE [Phaeovulum vinaykumarii]|uniref:Cell division protein ZapE n=2 Tax=Phaeovulum vinaykumarii TaxID=407234 RepID=A0A1N7L083_9RHOB|nr:cell division protein ZapE [Phaeovulum vinaykumarii]SOC00791.1 cell division protein ZapE [Phaeovulum vinaykumarii]